MRDISTHQAGSIASGGIYAIVPNWKQHSGLIPTDTSDPPRSHPVELQYLISDLRAEIGDAGSVAIIDLYLEGRRAEELKTDKRLRSATYIVVPTAPSYLFWRCPPLSLAPVRKIVSVLRHVAPKAIVIAYGPHGTSEPLDTLKQIGADYVLRGEIDPHLARAIRALMLGQDSLYLTSSQRVTPIAPQLPLDRPVLRQCVGRQPINEPHAWPQDARRTLIRRFEAFDLLETARGCSFDCHFCYRDGFRRALRLKSKEVLIAELEELARLGVQYLFLIDENFGVPASHASFVQQQLRKHGIKYGIQTRPDIWTKARIEGLASSGCCYVELGLETQSVQGHEALGKFHDIGLINANILAFRDCIEFVGCNIFDVDNPDLSLNPPARERGADDGYGNKPMAFIPYPHTPWGERAIERSGAHRDWLGAESLYTVYQLMQRPGWFGRLLTASARARRTCYRLIRWASPLLSRVAGASRYRRLKWARGQQQDLTSLTSDTSTE